MNTRLKLIALACAAPLALAACDSGQEEQQVGQAQDPAAPATEQERAAAPTEQERQTAAAPQDRAAQPPAGEPTAQAPQAPQQDTAQAPQQQPAAGAAGAAQADFAGNWAMEGEACPGEWEFTQQTVEVPEQGVFEIQDIRESGQGVELEVTSTTGEQTQTLALEFDNPQQPETMVVSNGADEVTLQRCQ